MYLKYFKKENFLILVIYRVFGKVARAREALTADSLDLLFIRWSEETLTAICLYYGEIPVSRVEPTKKLNLF